MKTPTPFHRLLAVLFTLMLCATPCRAVEVVIVADYQLRPVVEIISGIRKTLTASTRVYSPAEIKGNLSLVVAKENAQVVVTLGREALNEAFTLSPVIPVIYDLVVTPPAISRPNTTGFYMATPAREYTDFIRNHLPAIRHVSIVGSRYLLNLLASDVPSQATTHAVNNSYELVHTLKRQDKADAILVLPDPALLTSTALEEIYLFSFSRGVPLLGISEKQVRDGALMALVVDMVSVGRLIGEYATKALRVGSIPQQQALPPKRFELYLNTATARKMGIRLPDELIRLARKVYP